jgi:hypothetical protein
MFRSDFWRVAALGLLNHPNFRSLDVTTSDAAFGAVSASGPARNIQFAACLSF